MNTEERERPKKKHVADVFFHLLSNNKKQQQKQKQKQKQHSIVHNNKFGGDDNMHISSKVPPTTDEKHHGDGGHVNTRMQHPCLVARLMGLESMPTPRGGKEPINKYKACEVKESRPQKRQKPVSPPSNPLRSKTRRATTPPPPQQKLFSAEKSPKPHPKNAVGTIGRSRTVRDKCKEANVNTRNKNVKGRSVDNSMQRNKNVKGRSVDNSMQRSGSRSIARSRVKEFPVFGSGPSGCLQARAKESGRGRVESEIRRPNNSKHSIEHNRVRMEANGAGPIESTTSNDTRLRNKAAEKRRCVAKPNPRSSCHKNTVSAEKVENIKSRGPSSRGNEEVFVLKEIMETISMHRPRQQDGSGSDITDSLIHDKLQAKEEWSTTAYSPFSILEASFSNDSCLSRSPYRSSPNSSGRKPDTESASSCNNVQLSGQDVDLLDSASSLPSGKFVKEKIPSSLSENSISNARQLLGSIFSIESVGMRFVSDTVEAVMKGLDIRESTHRGVGKLLFDCTIECIDSKCNNLVEASRSLARRESLAQELQDEIVRWYSFSGKATNDLDPVQMDLSSSYGMWSRFADEACLIRTDIENDILNELVEETVMM